MTTNRDERREPRSSDDGPQTRAASAIGADGWQTPSTRALRVTMARAFPVRITPMREALVHGSITKLARP